MKSITLKNNLPVLFAPIPGTQTVTVLVLVRVGSRYEYKKINGASHFIEHLLFKGTKKRPTAQHISRALDAIGAEFNAYTDKHVTGYYVKVDKHYLELALDILSDMLFHSEFDARELNRERTVVIEEINMYRDNPMRHIEDMIEEVMFSGNTLSWNIAGTPKTMREMSRKEILAYHENYYQPSNMVLSIAGNIDRQAKTWIEKKFGKRKAASEQKDYKSFVVKKTLDDSKIKVQHKKTNQVQLAIGFPSFGVDDKRNPALNLLSVILGGNMSSRLFVKVRERKGLAYFVRASNHAYDDVGNFLIRAGLDRSRLKLATTIIIKELRSIVKNGVTASELKEAKTFVRGHLSIQLEDSYAQASWFARQKMFQKKLKTPKAHLKKIDALTRADLKQVAKEVLNEKQMSIAAIGPYKTKQEFLKHAGLL